MEKDERRRLLRELHVCMESKLCPFTITFFGALFGEVGMCTCTHMHVSCHVDLVGLSQGDVLICMEMMDKSLHEVYKLVYDKLGLRIPEEVVGKMAESVSVPVLLRPTPDLSLLPLRH